MKGTEMKQIYLDYAATTPMDPEVVKEIQPYFSKIYGNPSSIHSFGRDAKKAIDESRNKIATILGARTEELVFTSGGTEANNFAIKGIAYANKDKGNHIITSQIEHHAIIEPCKFLETQGFKVSYIPVDKDGIVDPNEIKKAITDKTILISIMHANNEIGTIQPIEEIGRIAKEKNVYFHTDAVQTAGHISLELTRFPVDLLSISAHKFYGPKGIGALFIRKGVKILPLMHGGEQENNRRASTENTAGIVGMGKALEISSEEIIKEFRRITQLRDKLISNILKIENTSLNGHPTKRLPNNINVSIEFIEGEAILLNLDLKGIACSTGSACSSASNEPSHVLTALKIAPEVCRSSLRFSLGKYTTEKDIDCVSETLKDVVDKLRKMSPLYKKRN